MGNLDSSIRALSLSRRRRAAYDRRVPEAASEYQTLETTLEGNRRRVEAALRRLGPAGGSPPVTAAIEYSLYAPAKRLRPILALMVTEILRGEPEAVLPAGCAVE